MSDARDGPSHALELRRIAITDAQHLLRWGAQPEFLDAFGAPAWSTVRAAEAWIRARDDGERRAFIAEHAHDGVVGLLTLALARPHARVSYAIDAAQRRRGHGTAAVRCGVRRALAAPGVARVEAVVRPDNLASRRLLERLGFYRAAQLRALEGEGRLHIYYSPSRR